MIKRILPYFNYLKPIWLKFSLGLLFGVVYSVASGLGLPLMAETIFPVLFGNLSESPKWLINIADTYFKGETDGSFLLLCCLAVPSVIFIRSIGAIGNGYFMAYSGISVVQSIQIDMFKKIQSLPLSFFNSYKTGEINSAVIGYPQRIRDVVVNTSNDLVIQPLTLISALSFLIYKSFENESFFIAIIGFATAPVIIFCIRRVGNYLALRSKELVKLGENLVSWTIESFQSPLEIRAYNLEEKQIHKFIKSLKQIFKVSMKSIRFSLFMSPSIELVSGLGIGFALFLGVKNGMGEGNFIALIFALYMAYTPIKKIGLIFNKLKVLEAPLNRLEAILHSEVSINSPQNPVKLKKPFKGDIEFKNVCFNYKKEVIALEGINFTIPFGESVGLIGESGAGKTTLANLLLRLYDPDSGKILFDNVDIRTLNLNEIRSIISYVPQSPILFNDTIYENIKIGNPNASDLDIINASKYARAHDFITQLEHGYESIISEGGKSLSGGQKQRISIARAFLKNSPILILDEATSSLDNKSDEEIKESLRLLCEGRTTIVIAHRLTTLQHINTRLLLKNGGIIGYGSHETLMKSCPEYKEIIKKPLD